MGTHWLEFLSVLTRTHKKALHTYDIIVPK